MKGNLLLTGFEPFGGDEVSVEKVAVNYTPQPRTTQVSYLYCASRFAREKGGKAQVGFIHIPATPAMMAGKPRGGPSMDEDLVREAVRQALTTIALSFTNCG